MGQDIFHSIPVEPAPCQIQFQRCPEHGVTVAAVPWARHQAGHTTVFDQQVAWLATQTSKGAVTELMRIAWRTVGSIIGRVWKDTAKTFDPFANLKRIGIDEISYKRDPST